MLPLDRRPARSWTGDVGCCCCCCCCCHHANPRGLAPAGPGAEPALNEPARGDAAKGSYPGALNDPVRGVLDCEGGHPLITHSSMVAEPHPNRPNPSPEPPPYEPQPEPLPEPPRDLPRRCLPRWWPERPGIAMGWGGAGFSLRVSPPEAPAAPPRATSTSPFPKFAPEDACCCVASATPPPALDDSGVGRALDASSALDDPPRSPSSVGAASSAESPPITNPPPPVVRPQRNAPSRGAILTLPKKGNPSKKHQPRNKRPQTSTLESSGWSGWKN